MATKAASSGNKRKAAPMGKSVNSGSRSSTTSKPAATPKKFSKPAPKKGAKESSSDDEMDDVSDVSDSDDGGAMLEDEADEPPQKKQKKSEGKNASSGKPTDKTESSRESHAQQKKLARERKIAKPLGDEVQRTKKIWERLRRKSHVPSEERKQLLDELFGIINGRIKEFVLKHDAVRAVQTAVKYSNSAQRKQITHELRGTFPQLAESRYAKFLIAKLIVQKESEIRDIIVPEFYGKVRRLINHPEASWILDDIYRQIANKEQKAILLREWYGPEFAILERSKDDKLTADLSAVLANDPNKKGPIMKNLFQMINSLVQKKMTGFTMLHDAMLQYYLNIAPGSEEYTNFVELTRDDETGDLLKNMAFTRSGSKVVCLLLANGGAKDRRNILRVFKDAFIMMSGDPYAHQVILTAYDVIDDTKMTSKLVFSELIGDDNDKAAESVIASIPNQFARTVLMYPFEGMSKTLFIPNMVEVKELMHQVHEIRQTTSKKDAELRRSELAAALSPALLSTIATSAPVLMSDPFGCHLISEVLFTAEGDKTEALAAVAAVAEGDPSIEPQEPVEDELAPAVMHVSHSPAGGRLLKSLIAGGRYNKETGKVDQVDPPLNFADTLYPVIQEHVVEWATGPSSLVVLAMLESPEFSHVKELKSKLKKSKAALEKAATEETPEQKARREALAEKDAEKKEAKKGKKAGAKAPADRPVGNSGSRMLIEKL